MSVFDDRIKMTVLGNACCLSVMLDVALCYDQQTVVRRE